MSLTAAEEDRIQTIEQDLGKLFRLLDGAGSKNRLNRWYALLSREMKRLEERMDDMNEDLEDALALARKLQ